SLARYTNDGSCRRGATSPGATSCGTSNTRTRGSAACVSTYATAELVVPRSMPIRYREATRGLLTTCRGEELQDRVDECPGIGLEVAREHGTLAVLHGFSAVDLAQRRAGRARREHVVVFEREVARDRAVVLLGDERDHVRLAHLVRRGHRQHADPP